MSNRLELIASFVEGGLGVADVGTDHGYIPVMLAKRGYKGNIIATDINDGPLQKAKQNLMDAECEDAVELILCDGLDGCKPEMVDTIIVAGIGGDAITGILDRAEWCAREDMKLSSSVSIAISERAIASSNRSQRRRYCGIGLLTTTLLSKAKRRSRKTAQCIRLSAPHQAETAGTWTQSFL